MKYQFTYPLLPSYRRMSVLYRAWPDQSLTRQLMNEKLQSIHLYGRCLDFGGGDNARYRTLLPGTIELYSLNIDAKFNPTHLIKPGEQFPFDKNYFDNIISMNTLEHIYDEKFVIEQMHHVLKPRGVLHIAVPFLYRIHGAPDDYSRHTPSWWRKTLHGAGFASVEVEALSWGRHSTVATFRRNSTLRFSMLMDIMRARKRCGNSARYFGKEGDRVCALALGWYITAIK